MSVIFEILGQFQRVIDDMIPNFGDKQGYNRKDSMLSPLTDKNLKVNLPEPVINILNKVYSRRLDFEK